jgi:hypothetical protein
MWDPISLPYFSLAQPTHHPNPPTLVQKLPSKKPQTTKKKDALIARSTPSSILHPPTQGNRQI